MRRKKLFGARSLLTLFLCISAFSLSAQTITVRGIVTDDGHEPVIGATVVVKGDPSKGTITDLDGNYVLNDVPSDGILTFSYVGLQPQDVRIEGRTTINVEMKSDTKLLDEVVVVGYGTQKKVNVTGAVSMINADAIEARPVANVSQALQGAIPGLNLTTSSNGGDLNTAMRINIRGTGTIGDGSVDSPLILIDGIEGNMNTLNPNDIESVSVLKDAASASIYGSRAAFGVILITTKSGKSGKVKVNYSGDMRFSTATQLPDMVDSYSFASYFNRASVNAGGPNQFNKETMERIQKFLRGEYTDPSKPEYYGTIADPKSGKWKDYTGAFANTDWFSEFYKKNVPSTQHNLSLSGGTEKFNWSVSGSVLNQNGLIRHGHDELNRYTMNSKLSAELAKWARLEYSIKWTRTDFEKPQYLTGLFFHNIARRWPTCPVKDPNGHWFEGMEIAELEDGGIYQEHKDHFTQQVKFTFNPITGWNIYAEGAMRTQNEKFTRNVIPVYHYYVNNTRFMRDSGYGSTTSVSDNRFRQNYYAVNMYTDYVRSFGKHNGKLLLGVNYERYDQDNLWGSGTDLTTSNKPYLSQAQKDKKNGDSYWNRATAGYFGRLNYDYDGKYLLEANIRYDGSSRFVGDKRWAWFPSFSVGYNIAREDFFEKLTDNISLLKLRTSWGQLGNTSSRYDSFWDWYPFYQQQSISSASGGWLINGEKPNTAYIPGIVNSSMTWETVETWDVGLDWAAFNNRLTGSFDWYSRTTKDMIGPAPRLGSVLGTNAPKTNNCDMRTTGWELEIGWRDRIRDFKYGARLNLSDARSKILRYPNETGDIYSYYNGKYLNEIWGYESVGIAKTDAEMTEWLKKNKPNWGSNWGAGDVMFKNLADRKDASGKIIDEGIVNSGNNTLDDHGDLKRIGNSTPRYRFGLNLDAEWKGFDFSIFFQGVLKRDWHFGSGDPYFWGAVGNVWQSAAFKEHMDYWTPENTGAYYPKPYFGEIRKNQIAQTRYLQDASYIRCKNLQFGYSLPQSVLHPSGLSNCRIYVSCDNLFTLTRLSSIYDPEVFGSYGDEGWGAAKTYPLQRTVSVGVNLSF